MMTLTAVAIAFLLCAAALLVLGTERLGWALAPSYIIFALMAGIACTPLP